MRGTLEHPSFSWGSKVPVSVTAGGASPFPLLSCAGVIEQTQGTLPRASPRSPMAGGWGGGLVPFSRVTMGSTGSVGGLPRVTQPVRGRADDRRAQPGGARHAHAHARTGCGSPPPAAPEGCPTPSLEGLWAAVSPLTVALHSLLEACGPEDAPSLGCGPPASSLVTRAGLRLSAPRGS